LHPSNPAASVGVASVENNTEAMLPVTTVKISGKNSRHKQGNIGIPEVKISRECGPIDKLIGIDHPYMHSGDSKKVGNVVARHSPLGWIIFGAIPGLQQTSRVFHVQYTRPVDLTDFLDE
jgi:hypothetical protein